MKVSDFIRRGCMIEVGCTTNRRRRPRPGYRWVQGWQVLNPGTGNWSVEMRLYDARSMVHWDRGGLT